MSESSLLCSSTVSTDTILVRAKSDDNLGVNDLNKSTVYFTTIVSHVLQILQETKKLFRTVKVSIPTANFIPAGVEELAGYGCHVYFS